MQAVDVVNPDIVAVARATAEADRLALLRASTAGQPAAAAMRPDQAPGPGQPRRVRRPR